MSGNNDHLSAESARELEKIIERDKSAAMAEFDTTVFAHHVQRRITADRSSHHPLAGHRLRYVLRPGALVAAAMVAGAIVVVALVVRVDPSRGRRTDPKMIARVLAGCEFFASIPLDPQPGSVAGESHRTPARDLEWAIQALLYRARRCSDGVAPVKGELARAILAAMAGAPPAAPAPWPRVDPDALARRIAILSRKGAFLRALGNMQ
jgi:hypothetical protein